MPSHIPDKLSARSSLLAGCAAPRSLTTSFRRCQSGPTSRFTGSAQSTWLKPEPLFRGLRCKRSFDCACGIRLARRPWMVTPYTRRVENALDGLVYATYVLLVPVMPHEEAVHGAL